MSPERLEKMMFAKVNPHIIPEVKELVGHPFGENQTYSLLRQRVKATKSQDGDAGKSVFVDRSF